ncbi:MAG TPA: hypothetical protein VFR34_06685 [Paracoccaceae bacterium]|nr:hypothetical protein [Paracoccaceae bacterium]
MNRFLTAAPLALAAACAGTAPLGTRVYNVDNPRSAGYEVRATLSGTAPLAVLGTPPDGAAPESVAAALRVPAKFGGGGFRLVPAVSTENRIVVAFGRVAPRQLCAGQGGQERPPSLVASAAFCRGPRPLASGVMEATATGPSDPAFASSFLALFGEMLETRRVGGAPR